MEYLPTGLNGPVIIKPKVFGDSRGFFMETFSLRDFEAHVGPVHFVQDNESYSARRGVLRGMHFQKGDAAQAKLVRVSRGRVLDVAVDLRPDEPTFGQHYEIELSDQNHRRLLIPRGFAHGFAVLSEKALFQYKCDNFYAPQEEDGIAWNDPELSIDWRLPAADVILSERDKSRQSFREWMEKSL